eukprot:UN30916
MKNVFHLIKNANRTDLGMMMSKCQFMTELLGLKVGSEDADPLTVIDTNSTITNGLPDKIITKYNRVGNFSGSINDIVPIINTKSGKPSCAYHKTKPIVIGSALGTSDALSEHGTLLVKNCIMWLAEKVGKLKNEEAWVPSGNREELKTSIKKLNDEFIECQKQRNLKNVLNYPKV